MPDESLYYDWQNPKVGHIVYPAYTPAKAGKVIAVNGERVGVKHRDGSERTHLAGNLNCLRSLITGHERKLQTHRKILHDLTVTTRPK